MLNVTIKTKADHTGSQESVVASLSTWALRLRLGSIGLSCRIRLNCVPAGPVAFSAVCPLIANRGFTRSWTARDNPAPLAWLKRPSPLAAESSSGSSQFHPRERIFTPAEESNIYAKSSRLRIVKSAHDRSIFIRGDSRFSEVVWFPESTSFPQPARRRRPPIPSGFCLLRRLVPKCTLRWASCGCVRLRVMSQPRIRTVSRRCASRN